MNTDDQKWIKSGIRGQFDVIKTGIRTFRFATFFAFFTARLLGKMIHYAGFDKYLSDQKVQSFILNY